MRGLTFVEVPAVFRSGKGVGRAAFAIAGSFGMSVARCARGIRRNSMVDYKVREVASLWYGDSFTKEPLPRHDESSHGASDIVNTT